MPNFTPNLNLEKPLQNEFYNVEVPNANMDKLDVALGNQSSELNTHLANNVAHNRYGVASGVNVKIITIEPTPVSYVEGMSITFKNVTENTTNVGININNLGAKNLINTNGASIRPAQLKAGGIYTVTYDGSNFILQGEGGGGSYYATGSVMADSSGFLTVSGIHFLPRQVICRDPNFKSSVWSLYDDFLPNQVFLDTSGTYGYSSNTGGYFNSTGFKMRVPFESIIYTWEAYSK